MIPDQPRENSFQGVLSLFEHAKRENRRHESTALEHSVSFPSVGCTASCHISLRTGSDPSGPQEETLLMLSWTEAALLPITTSWIAVKLDPFFSWVHIMFPFSFKCQTLHVADTLPYISSSAVKHKLWANMKQSIAKDLHTCSTCVTQCFNLKNKVSADTPIKTKWEWGA